jgi:anti-sigma B factor antagonist
LDDQEQVVPTRLRHTVAELPEQIDITNAQQVEEQLAGALGSESRVVIVDLGRTTFCDSSGVRMLVLAARRAAASGIALRLVVTSAAVSRIFELSGLDTLLPVYASVGEALGGDTA